MSSARRSPFAALLAVSLLLNMANALEAPARADVVDSFYLNSSTFSYRITNMPDFDGWRSAWQNNGVESGHVLPFATGMNLFAYAANHGIIVPPGAANWQAQTSYVAATQTISNFWQHPGYVPGGEFERVAASYQARTSLSNQLTFIGLAISEWYTPNAAQLAKLAVNGWIVNIVVGVGGASTDSQGFYQFSPQKTRHLTLTGLSAINGVRQIRARDAWTDRFELTTQSTFADWVVPWQSVSVTLAGFGTRTLTSMGPPPDVGLATDRMILGWYAIRPKFGYAFKDQGGGAPGVLASLQSVNMIGSPNGLAAELTLEAGFVPIHLMLQLGESRVLALLRPESQGAWQARFIDLATGEQSPVPRLPFDPRLVSASRKGPYFVVDGSGKLYRCDPQNGATINATSAVPPVVAIEADDSTDSVWLLSHAQRRLVRRSEDLGSTLSNWTLPAWVPLSSTASLAVEPGSGMPFFVSSASSAIYGARLDVTGVVVIDSISLPQITNPKAITFGPGGELVVCDGGVLKVLRRTSGGSWALDASDPFHGQAAGVPFVLSQSRHNSDLLTHAGPEWNSEIDPPELGAGVEVADCFADIDGDGIVGGADLGVLLGAWNAATSAADLNGDGIVDGADLGLLLGTWGRCR